LAVGFAYRIMCHRRGRHRHFDTCDSRGKDKAGGNPEIRIMNNE